MYSSLAVDLLREAATVLGGDGARDRGLLARSWAGGQHLHDCRISMAVDGYHAPHGAPCSSRCARVNALATAIGDYLAAHDGQRRGRRAG